MGELFAIVFVLARAALPYVLGGLLRLSACGWKGKPSIPIRWYDLYQSGPRPDRVWTRIPDAVHERIIKLALDAPALSPRELALRFADTENYSVSEASVYRLLKAHDLIPSPLSSS